LSDCLELSALANRAEPAPAPAVLELVAAELPGAAADLFAEFAPEPVESGLLFQAHRARLRSGEEVVVRVVRPSVEASLALDLELLPLLAGLSDGRRGGLPFAAAVEDFRTALPQRLDLTAQADGLEALAADLERSPLVRVPRVLRELSGPRVIVLEWLAGTAIDDDPPPDGAPAVAAARRLAVAWLHQALLGRVLPVELRGAETLLPVGDGVIFTGGQFARPAASQQANLLGYLTAAADRDPDEAATHLLREMVATGPAGEEEIRLLLRQVVPFRDGAWSAGGDSLAEHVAVHWRLAAEGGFRPRLHLLGFLRGFIAVAAVCRRLAPERDLMQEALHEVRLAASASRFQEMLTARQLRDSLERYAVLMSELPQRLDDALTRLAAPPSGPPPAASGDERVRRQPALIVAAFVLATATVAALAHQLTAAGAAWVEKPAAVLVVVLGALTLRALRAGG